MNINVLTESPIGPIDMLAAIETKAYDNVQALVAEGKLPVDTFLRLDSLGENKTYNHHGEQLSVRRLVLLDLDLSEGDPNRLLLKTRNAIFKERPKALICWSPALDQDILHTWYDEPFLTKYDLAEVIKERRLNEGKTTTQVPRDSRWRHPKDVERAQCQRIAHGIWRVLAGRIVPEWLKPENLDTYYRPHKVGPNHYELESSNQVMRRKIVGAVALRTSFIKKIYDESVETNVRGIGPQGRFDLRTLLAEQYPELN